ncbi:MAG TPA: LamG-like jellyroll fold domain-containing protein, partial [Verrucomicrobiae bacterium]|nr:LamG-like jellyroll fold domain-containing protein [Verrucomicrobiae bacterium]
PTSPGLVAAYSFNEGSGTTVADLSGNGNGGSLSSTTTWNAAGKYGSALSFSGTTARVTIADAPSLRLTNAMTLEAWVNPTTVSSAWRDVIYKGNDIYYLMATTSNGSGRPAVGGTFNAVNVNLYGTAVLAVNTWSHLAGTYDGTTLRLYVNGLQVSTLTQPGLIQTSTNPLQIGGDSIFGQTFQGQIDEVRVYNRALSAAEIQTDMNTAIGAAQNTAPTISAVSNQTINEDTSTAAIAFTVGDAESSPASLVVSGSSSNPTLVPNANIVFGGSGANRTVTVTPAAGQSGTATINVTVSDGTNSANTSFVLTVTPLVNTAPTISAVSNQTINEDTSTAAIAFTVSDAESSPASLVVSGSSSNPTLVPSANMIFGGSGANRTVTVLPATNQNGTATLTLTVSDGALTTGTSFVLTVTPVNDVPTITSLANQTIPANTSTPPLTFTVADVETAAGNLSVSGSSSNPTLVPNANIVLGGSGANRTVTVTPAAGQSGTATITVTVSDGTNSAGSSFVLTVIPPTSPGLVAAYSFNEGSGPTVADGSGRGNTGTVSNTTWSTNGKYGNALVFNGSNSRVTIPDAPSLRLTNGMTLEAWVNPSVVSKSWRDVIYKGNANYYLAATTSTGNGKPAVGGTFGGANADVTWVNVLTENTWSHLAGTSDGTTLRLYLNGTQVASRGQTGLILTSANPLEIGSDTVLGQPFQGLIDEVRVYNRALSATEIQTDMNTALPTGGFSAAAETLDQPVLTIIRTAGSGGRRLWVTGSPNAAYQIEASDDLVTWSSLGTVQEPTGVGSFIDPTAAEHPQRFYRAARTR